MEARGIHHVGVAVADLDEGTDYCAKRVTRQIVELHGQFRHDKLIEADSFHIRLALKRRMQ